MFEHDPTAKCCCGMTQAEKDAANEWGERDIAAFREVCTEAQVPDELASGMLRANVLVREQVKRVMKEEGFMWTLTYEDIAIAMLLCLRRGDLASKIRYGAARSGPVGNEIWKRLHDEHPDLPEFAPIPGFETATPFATVYFRQILREGGNPVNFGNPSDYEIIPCSETHANVSLMGLNPDVLAAVTPKA